MNMSNLQLKLYNRFFLRIFDVSISLFGLIIGLPLMLVVLVMGFFDTGSPIFCQERVGKNKNPFLLFKFRTMQLNTDSVASHLAQRSSITKFGALLRKTKVDELPQLINVLKGEMSLVGPRPCLYNQTEVISERERLGVFKVLPGITGLAQIKGVDMSTPSYLASLDNELILSLSIVSYFRYIFATLIGGGFGDGIRSID